MPKTNQNPTPRHVRRFALIRLNFKSEKEMSVEVTRRIEEIALREKAIVTIEGMTTDGDELFILLDWWTQSMSEPPQTITQGA